MPVSMLDDDFKKILEKHYKKYQYIDTEPNYTRPTLHFINSKIINLPINLNFSKKEIIALVSKIKDDYDTRESIIKTPIELLKEKVEKAISALNFFISIESSSSIFSAISFNFSKLSYSPISMYKHS